MPLSELHVLHVCDVTSPDQNACRYLSEDMLYNNVYQCLKLTGQKRIIDESINEYLAKNNLTQKLSLGDNCCGYPILRHKTVGYDKKNS
jgi:hypothetical protein